MQSGKAGVDFSFGVADLEGSEDLVSLLGRADREMYTAKARRGASPQLRIEPLPSPRFRPESPDLNVGA
jgi:hypothetical protein